MKLRYHETEQKIYLWDAEPLNQVGEKFTRKKPTYPLTQSDAKTDNGRELFRKMRTCNKTALLNLKHKFINVRVFAYYKLKNKEDIQEANSEEFAILCMNMHFNTYWLQDQYKARQNNKIYGG